MANQERITCDYQGCTNEYTYRVKGFNLCAEHCFDTDSAIWAQFVKAKQARLREDEHGSD